MQHLINPHTWAFGQPLREYQVYNAISNEPGVEHAEHIEFVVDQMPDSKVGVLSADKFQPKTWYAGASNLLFRSSNNGDSWENIKQFDHEIVCIESHPERPGRIAITTTNFTQPEQPVSSICISLDCGESWQPEVKTTYEIHDIAWLPHADEVSRLLMATEKRLFVLAAVLDASPVHIPISLQREGYGFDAIVSTTDSQGKTIVAIASEGFGDILLSEDFLSSAQKQSDSFAWIKIPRADIQNLEIEKSDSRIFLWAGAQIPKNKPERPVCFRREITNGGRKWETPSTPESWKGGSCLKIVSQGAKVYASFQTGGILSIDTSESKLAWKAGSVDCGLPINSEENCLEAVEALGIQQGLEQAESVLIAGGVRGVFRRTYEKDTDWYQNISSATLTKKIMLPPTWVFCSGVHEVQVR